MVTIFDEALIVVTKAINDAGGPLGVEAVVGEGFCPVCRGRSSQRPVVDPEDEEIDHRRPEATVDCQPCQIRWRTGHCPVSGELWIEHTHVLGPMVLVLTINPPEEPGDAR